MEVKRERKILLKFEHMNSIKDDRISWMLFLYEVEGGVKNR